MAKENMVAAEGRHYNRQNMQSISLEKFLADELPGRIESGMAEDAARKMLTDLWTTANPVPGGKEKK